MTESQKTIFVTILISVWSFFAFEETHAREELGPPPLEIDEVVQEATQWYVQARAALNIDPDSRASVAAAYNNIYPESNGVSINWTGSTGSCTAGTISQAFRDATIKRVNFFRGLAGLPAVTENTSQHTKCLEAALMMSAANSLSHFPSTSWACYSAGGAEAASKSNLALGRGGAGAIDLYMDDFGSGNVDVGHRRWILFPPLAQVGTGSVPGTSGKSSADALWVLSNSGTRPSSPAFIQWPSKFMPYQLLPSSKRWSFTMNGADFANATVTVKLGNTTLDVGIEARNGSYGDKALVFLVNGVSAAKPSSDTLYSVKIENVKVGSNTQSFEYTVTIIDPATSGGGNSNSPPVVTSPANANPANAKVNQEVTFTVAASDPNNDTLTYTWNFGDSSSGQGSTVKHAYATAGTFNVAVTISDGKGGNTNSTTAVNVTESGGGDGGDTFVSLSDVDTDGDGFPDEFEEAMGTSPTNAGSTPENLGPQTTLPIQLSKLRIKLNFVLSDRDTLKFNGLFDAPFTAGNAIHFFVGGETITVNPDPKGKHSGEALKFKLNLKKNSFLLRTRKENHKTSWADEGLIDTQIRDALRTLPVFVIYEGKLYRADIQVKYSAKSGKWGNARSL